jgi:hypothetical protein
VEQSNDYYQIKRLSNSFLTTIKREFLKGSSFYLDPEVLQSAYAFGSLVDALIFEPEKVDVLHPKIEQGRRMKEAFLSNKLCAKFIRMKECQPQHEYYKMYQGEPFKAKLDAVIKNLKTGLEFKTTACSSQSSFRKTAFEELDYDRQIAIYMDIANLDIMLLAAVSKTPKPKVFTIVVERGDEVYLSGKNKANYLIDVYKQHIKPLGIFGKTVVSAKS